MTNQRILNALAVAALLLWPGNAPAEQTTQTVSAAPTTVASPSTTSTAPVPTIDAIAAQLKSVQDNKSLPEDARKGAADLLQQAQEQAKTAAEWQRRGTEFETAAAAAPERAAALRKDAGTTPTLDFPTEIPTTATAAQADRIAERAEAALSAAQKRLAEIKAEQTRRVTRRAELPRLATAARQKLNDLGPDKVTPPRPGEAMEIATARVLLAAAQRAALEAEARCHEHELALFDASADLLSLQADEAAVRVTATEAAARRLRDVSNELRKQQAAAAVREAQRARAEAASASPAIRTLAEENEKLAQQRAGLNGLTSNIESTARDLQSIAVLRTRIGEQFDSARKRVAAAGNSNVVGRLLLRLLAGLPDPAVHERNIAARADTIAGVQIRLLDLDEMREDMADLEAGIRSSVEADRGVKWEDAEAQVKELLQKRRELLNALITDNNTYFANLVELDTNERLLLSEVSRFSAFLKERVLWIPSAQPVSLADFSRAAEAVRWLVNPSAWTDLVGALWKDAVRNPGLTIPVLLLAFAMWNYRPRLKERLRENGARRLAGLPATFTNTLRALGLTIALTLPFPLFLWYVGWRLGGAPSTTDLAPALGQALRRVAVVLSSFELLRMSLHSNGLAEAHLGWSTQALAVMRQNLRWALPVVMVTALVRLTLENQDAELRRDSLGRLAFCGGIMVLAAFNARVLNPRRGAVAGWLASHKGNLPERLSPVWYWLLVGSPVVFAILSLLGYSYTAFRLTMLFVISLWLILAVMLGSSLLSLWFQIARRNLALREARKKADSQAAEAERDNLPEAAPATRVDEEPDMTAMAAQLNRLVGGLAWTVLLVGLWLVWSSVLPAFEILRNVELWRHTVKVAEMMAQPDGTSRLQVVDKVEAVTLLNVFIAMLLGGLTIAATRNVPAVMEVSFLRRLNFDSGLRYAITSVSRYIIIILGILAVFSSLGVGWSNVQWLAAAASVGLGFGLQEILANFVSGIIILFERPIRVGDLVTIGKTTGTVTQVRIRATTIRDWDGRDLLVPNKQIITNEVVNWTLADTLSRITFSVTADNDSDPVKVRELLLEMARSHPLVLSDPAPFALFEGFGDSGLNFKLFTFVHKLSDRGQVTNDLNARIQEVFAREGIGIAYPVRDMILAYPAPAKADEKP